jgi:hypothetical protein
MKTPHRQTPHDNEQNGDDCRHRRNTHFLHAVAECRDEHRAAAAGIAESIASNDSTHLMAACLPFPDRSARSAEQRKPDPIVPERHAVIPACITVSAAPDPRSCTDHPCRADTGDACGCDSPIGPMCCLNSTVATKTPESGALWNSTKSCLGACVMRFCSTPPISRTQQIQFPVSRDDDCPTRSET